MQNFSSDTLKAHSSSFFPAGLEEGAEVPPSDDARWAAIWGDARPSREQSHNRLPAPRARTRPPSCCGPATAVSVFYDDFLRLSFFQANEKLRGPSVFLFCVFPVPRSETETGTRAYTHRACLAPQSPLGPRGTGTSGAQAPATTLQGPEMTGSRGTGGGVRRRLSENSETHTSPSVN